MTATRFSPPPAAGQVTSRAAPPARGGFRSLILDIGIPVGSYYLLRALGCDVVTSLALSSVPPAAQSVLALYQTLRHDDPRRDLDLASYGLAAILDDNGTDWRPKEAFRALAVAYGRTER